MKKYFFVLLLGLVLTAGCLIYVPSDYRDEPSPYEQDYYDEGLGAAEVDIAYFYDYLSPYGVWTSSSPYGYVWIPHGTGYGWRPYSHGRWIWSDYGWTWVSEYKWGWAPFHYGRWGWDEYLGWYWKPGTVWGPAWVSWRRGNNYIGWAPIPPDVRFVAGMGITSLPRSLHHSHWLFVEGRYFYNTRLYRYVLPYERNLTIINYTVINTHIVMRDRRIYNRGYDIDYVQGLSRHKIRKHELADSTRVGQSRVLEDRVEVYKPKLRESSSARPKTVIDKSEVSTKVRKSRLTSSGSRAARDEEIELQQTHERQTKILERTQKKEIADLEEKSKTETKSASTSAEKKKIEKQYQEKKTKLQTQHKKEKSSIKKRQQTEKTKVKKKTIKKKK